MTARPPADGPAQAPAQPISRAQKDALLLQNRQNLDQDLTTQRLVWRSMPRVVDLQLSNFCNMSCTMCYDGRNPPMKKLDPALVERFAAEVLPTTAVMVPFAGSEPLIVTWDLTRDLARRFDLELEMITNAQFLDEAKFREVEPHVSAITFSIDSHMLDVYARIRQRSVPAKVFENLPRAARLCRENGIEPHANVVFMVENAAYMDETVAFLADQGCSTVRMLAFHQPPTATGDRTFSDAVKHMSPAWIDWMLGRVWKVAEQKRINIVFEGLTRRESDFRPKDVTFRPDRKAMHSLWNELPYWFPGYCTMSVDRIKVTVDGNVHPCCVAEGDNLVLGNLHKQTFQEVWNGPNAQELRRAMLVQQLPEICRKCGFHTAYIPKELAHMPVVDWYHDSHCGGTVPQVPVERRTLVVDGPGHMSRTTAAPTIHWQAPATPVDEYHLVFGVAGTWHPSNRVVVAPGSATSLRVPDDVWSQLPANVGLWWFLCGLRKGDLAASVRSPMLRCVLRHQDLPPVPGHTLRG